MIGLLFLAILGIYVAFWVFVALRFKQRWPKALVALVAIAIPTWDLIPQELQFRKLCRNEIGQQFFVGPVEVDGFFAPTMGVGLATAFVKEEGYQYVETLQTDPMGNGLEKFPVRVEVSESGEIVVTRVTEPESRYQLVDIREPRPWATSVTGQRVVETGSGKVLAENIAAHKSRSWVERVLVPQGFPSGGPSCDGVFRPELSLPTKFLLARPRPNQITREHKSNANHS